MQQPLSFLHAEPGPLIARALVSVTEQRPVKLSPRLRQTLAYLLEGDSEKQVADRLGPSHATTHQYVTGALSPFRGREPSPAYGLCPETRRGVTT